jgi:tetratricopeptide (TPR) repeat protein
MKYARAVLAAVLLTAVAGACVAHAEEGAITSECASNAVAEQSILVATGKTAGSGTSPTTGAGANHALEPIAVVSEYVPDLAEPAGSKPELANLEPASPTVEVTDRPALVEDASVASAEEASAGAEVLSFHGITPGISTRSDVLQAWGDPLEKQQGAAKLLYHFDKLKSVQVEFDGDVVDTIVVELPRSLPAHKLVAHLGLDDLRPTLEADSSGAPVARVYPERGIVFWFAKDRVVSVVSDNFDPAAEEGYYIDKIDLQPIKASAFLLRAENETNNDLTLSLADLEEALKLDDNCADAKCLLSELSLKLGKAVTAERLAAEALEIDPRNNHYRLQHAKCLQHLARYDLAAEEAKKVLESSTLEKIERAQALHQMGVLASLGSAEVAERTVPLISKAIELADQLANDKNAEVRLDANQLLVTAHLDMAVFISRGKWGKKSQAVPQWIERASALSEGMIHADRRQLALRLQVAISALAAAANLDPPIHPELWVEEAEQTAAQLRDQTNDPLLRGCHDWSLGLAYFQAAQLEHRRSQPESALRLSAMAEAKLTDLARQRDEMPDTAFLMGRLYFQTGAIHAIHFEDHAEACSWYDKAVNLLVNPVPVTTMSGPQQHGDALVSMGVSYWHEGHRQRAVDLTQSGVTLIEQAVEKGLLDADSLLVPYGNLAAMYEAQGDSEPAARYNRLAREITNRQERR